MKKLFLNRLQYLFIALGLLMLISSCEKDDFGDNNNSQLNQDRIAISFKNQNTVSNARYNFNVCGNKYTTRLLAGKTIPVGEVSAYNDDENLYITVSIEGDYLEDWFIRNLHMYIGQVSVDFSQKVGKKNEIVNPAPGKFPFKEEVPSDNPTGIQEYTWTLPIGEDLIDFGEFDIAVHADVIRVEDVIYENGVAVSARVAQSEGAWSEGEVFSQKGNWAMYFSYSITECDVNCDPKWNRTVEVTRNDFYNAVGDELEVIYQVNGANGGKVGLVKIHRGGNKNAANKFTFTTTFIPDNGFNFKEMEVCIAATDNESDAGTCSSTITVNSDGQKEIVIRSAPFTSTGDGNTAAKSFVKLYVISDACD